MKEQYQRFCEAVSAPNCCEGCPIQKECEEFSATLSPFEDYCEEYSCEMLLFRYIMYGEKPKNNA